MTSITPEFSRLLPVDRVPQEGSTESIDADDEECEALAHRFGLPAIISLSAALVAERWRGGGLRVTGTFSAEVEQICVVTLDPFRARVGGPVERNYLPPSVSNEADENVDPLVNGAADLGELVSETLALSLDPYPRKPGVSFDQNRPAQTGGAFDALQALRDKGRQ
jgi:uncharacterized metal-binding protein YceD (DUF177 family)